MGPASVSPLVRFIALGAAVVAIACGGDGGAQDGGLADGGLADGGGAGGCWHDNSKPDAGLSLSYLSLRLVRPDAGVDVCQSDGGGGAVREVVGTVAVDPDGGVWLEGCENGSHCGRYELRAVTVGGNARSVLPAFRAGQPLYVRWQLNSGSWSCTARVEVRAERAAGPWLFSAITGSYSAPAEAPFTTSVVNLGCHPGRTCSGNLAVSDDQAIVFTPKADAGAPLRLQSGEEGTLALGDGGTFEVGNVRSFQPGWCDDYWNYAYWVRSTSS